jgi:hypothetical protein
MDVYGRKPVKDRRSVSSRSSSATKPRAPNEVESQETRENQDTTTPRSSPGGFSSIRSSSSGSRGGEAVQGPSVVSMTGMRHLITGGLSLLTSPRSAWDTGLITPSEAFLFGKHQKTYDKFLHVVCPWFCWFCRFRTSGVRHATRSLTARANRAPALGENTAFVFPFRLFCRSLCHGTDT